MIHACSRPECQTTGGCAHRGPHGELCWFLTSNYQQQLGRIEFPTMGCICPPTSEQTCQSPICPRRATTHKPGSATRSE